jgi:uncharacterized LabA/DUF88 family protein
VTTQHMHHEHGDADTSVVEYPSALETTTNPTTYTTTTSVEAQGDADVSSPELASPESAFNPDIQEKSALVSPETETTPALGAKTEEIRPFTDFIEEFRLAESMRSQGALHDSQGEALPLLESTMSAFAASASTTDTADAIQGGSAIGQSVQHPSVPLGPIATDQAPAPSARADENGSVASTGSEDRAVSPLLRPATRLRMPRHGGGRHHREEQANLAETPAPVQPETAQTVPNEPPAATAPAKPARRYRFDRPKSPTTPSTSGTNGVYGMNGSTPAAASKFTPAVDLAIIGEQAAPEATQPAHKFPATSAENTGATLASPAEQGRRRHGQQAQQKEQQSTPASLASQAEAMSVPELASDPEPSVPSANVAPEDLSPLEYAELQKSSSRRRRRHRSGSSTNAPARPAASKSSAVPPTSQQPSGLMPQMPASPAVNASSNYAIVSGYTVNQMNQGNEVAGPFLGPEPSPARGSGFTRDARPPMRPGSQRPPAVPAFPINRLGDGGLASGPVNQFATVVSQAIETQTDRIVAEFRRLSQAPTNVSVSLPPFPSSERVGVFVDVANLLYSARTLRIAVDFGKLLDFLRGNRRLIRAHAYCPTSPQPGDEQTFLQAVKGLGYRITTKHYKTFSSGAKKADLDLDLCMDVVRLVDGRAVDCIVLLSGDSDFMPMLDYCTDHGVRVEVAAFDEAMSATLRQSCDLFINLSMLEEIRA